MKSICNIGLTMLMCTATGCCARTLKDCQNLKADDPKIVEFANKCANTCGSSDLAAFDQPKVTEYPDHWNVFYQGKASADGYRVIGKHFIVEIDRKTCKGEVIPGG